MLTLPRHYALLLIRNYLQPWKKSEKSTAHLTAMVLKKKLNRLYNTLKLPKTKLKINLASQYRQKVPEISPKSKI